MLRGLSDFCAGDHAHGDEDPFGNQQQQQQQQQQPQQQQGANSNGRNSLKKPEVVHLATFIVGKAVLSAGVVRPITFFPIATSIESINSSMYSVPQVPQGPHLCSVDIGVRQNRWADSFPTHVDRRYSELVDFRTLLAYQFPTLIVPPLPPKSKFDDLGTFLTSENVLVAQQHSIVRFLREVAMCPEFIHFSVYTPNFFQLPRESFEDWLGTMRSVLDDFRRCNAAIDAHSTRKGGLLGSESITNFTDGSTKAVRKLVGFLHSWMGGGEKEAENFNESDRHRHRTTSNTGEDVTAGTSSRQPPVPSSSSSAAAAAASLSPAQIHSSVASALQYWTEELRVLTANRNALAATTTPYLLSMEHAVGTVEAMKDVAAGLECTAAVLHTAGAVHVDLERVVREAAAFTTAAAGAIDRQQAKNKREVYERLLFEIAYIDAARDAIDHVLCLWRHVENLDVRAKTKYASYIRNVSSQLHNFYETRFLRNFRHRMRNMIQRMADTGNDFMTAMEKEMQATAFAATIRDQECMRYNTEPLQQYGEVSYDGRA